MYQLKIVRANGAVENFQFNTLDERENFLMNNWDDDADFLVPCVYGGWIDVRDC